MSITAVTCGDCECYEYIYANSPFSGTVEKFRVNSDGTLTEIGNPWYPGGATPNPHGLGVDLNGRLYIGQDFNKDGIRRFDSDGTIHPATDWYFESKGQFNIGSIGNTLYFNNEHLIVINLRGEILQLWIFAHKCRLGQYNFARQMWYTIGVSI